MAEPGTDEPEADEALAWRNQAALRLLRVFTGIVVLALPLLWFGLPGRESRNTLTPLALLCLFVVGVPAVTGRPRGKGRAWIIVVTAIVIALSGYAFVGVLSGPGVCLTVALMLAGLLLGRRALLGVTAVSLVAASAIGAAMATGRLAAPDPGDIAMTSAWTWGRSLSVTFLAILLFSSMMLALVSRMERSLRLARRETLRREQAERERAEVQLLALESRQLEVVGRLAAGIAHDFNNNLTAIMGSAELLKAELPAPHEGRELSEGILQASRRLAELTRQLLAYSRKARMQQTPTDLHVIVEEAVSLLRRSIDPNIRIVTELHAGHSLVAADAALLQSAILNLLVNARDAMPKGGTLTIGTALVELTRATAKGLPAGPCIVLEVVDTGQGIPRDQLPHIFDPFYTTKPIGQGTGLGLAAVSGTVKAHGGSVEVNSTEGVGSAFRIYLPTLESDSQVTLTAATSVVHGQGDILVVEDDAMVSMTAVATLRSLGYDVVHAADGKQALEQVRAHPGRFQLALLDLRMPGMGGEAAFDKLRQLEPSLPILIWSGYATEQDVDEMLRRGAVGFVQKPYRVAELSRTVAENVRSRRQRTSA